MYTEALAKAVDLAGGQAALARLIDKSQRHVWVWLQRGKCPPDMAVPIEEATGVPRHELRPDIFPAPVPAE